MRYQIQGIECNACETLVGMAVEDFPEVTLVQEDEKFYVNVPTDFDTAELKQALAEINPEKEYLLVETS